MVKGHIAHIKHVLPQNETTKSTQTYDNAAYKIPPTPSQCSRFWENTYIEDI
jgi:hypothetical protein